MSGLRQYSAPHRYSVSGTFSEPQVTAAREHVVIEVQGRNHDTVGCLHREHALAKLPLQIAMRVRDLFDETIAASADITTGSRGNLEQRNGAGHPRRPRWTPEESVMRLSPNHVSLYQSGGLMLRWPGLARQAAGHDGQHSAAQDFPSVHRKRGVSLAVADERLSRLHATFASLDADLLAGDTSPSLYHRWWAVVRDALPIRAKAARMLTTLGCESADDVLGLRPAEFGTPQNCGRVPRAELSAFAQERRRVRGES